MTILNKILHLTFSSSTVVIANIFVMVVASRYLSLHDYATFRQTFLPYEIMVPILMLGIPATIHYLLPRREDKLNLIFQSILMMTFTSLLFSSFLIFGGIALLADWFHNPDLLTSLKWLIIYPFFQIPITLLSAIFIFEGKTKFIGIFSSTFAIIFAVLAVSLTILNKNYMDIVLLKIFLPILSSTLLLFYIFKLLKSPINIKQLFSPEKLISILRVSMPFGLASMLGVLSLQIDKILVSTLATTEEFAIYINGAMEIPLIGILTGSIASVLLGEMSKNIKENKLDMALSLFKISATKTALILFPIMVYLLFNAKELMILLYSEKYTLSALPFTIYLLLLPIRIVVFGSVLIAMGKSKVILYRSLAELPLNIILSILMFKLFGYLGIAIATVIVTYLWSVPYNLKEISKGFAVKVRTLFDLKNLTKIMFISLIAAPSMLVSDFFEPILLKIILSFIVYSLFVAILYFYSHLLDLQSMKESWLNQKGLQ